MTLFRWPVRGGARYRRRPGLRWKTLPGSAAVLDDAEGRLVHFSDAGARIWEELDGRKSVAELARLLGAEFSAPLGVLEDDAQAFLSRLSAMELVERADR